MNKRIIPPGRPGVDAEGLHLRRHRLAVAALQHLERADHVAGAGEIRTAAVGAEFPVPRKPADDHAGEDAEHELRHHRGHEEADAGARRGRS